MLLYIYQIHINFRKRIGTNGLVVNTQMSGLLNIVPMKMHFFIITITAIVRLLQGHKFV